MSIVIIHVLIALTSVGVTTYAFFKPSKKLLMGAYALVVGTLVSGVYLIVSAPSHMIEACISGIVYLSVISVGIMIIRTKLAARNVRNQI
jgi:hypothetical protein